jgi:exopolyphosphatase
MPAADIALRPEFLALFRHANIEPRHLITLDDLPPLSGIQDHLPPQNTRWILVDHNALQGELGRAYGSRVGGVIDHHDDEGVIGEDTAPEPRIIEKAGSCTSLVVNFGRETWNEVALGARVAGAANAQVDGGGVLDDDAVVRLWHAQVALLGLGSVLIDTNNLKSKEKTTEHDRAAVKYLEARAMACAKVAGTYDRKRFFEELDEAKRDVGSLGLRDILRKDYKQWTEGEQKLGISSVVKSLDFLIKKASDEAAAAASVTDSADESSFFKQLKNFAQERGLGLYAIMTNSTSPAGKHQRELLVWSFNEESMAAAKRFASDTGEQLGLEDLQEVDVDSKVKLGEGEWLKVWRQRNVRHSRKQVAPLLRQAMI